MHRFPMDRVASADALPDVLTKKQISKGSGSRQDQGFEGGWSCLV